MAKQIWNDWKKLPKGDGGGGGFEPTEEQLDAINSGINTEKVAQIENNTELINDINATLDEEIKPTLQDLPEEYVQQMGDTNDDYVYGHSGETEMAFKVIPNKITEDDLSNLNIGTTEAIFNLFKDGAKIKIEQSMPTAREFNTLYFIKGDLPNTFELYYCYDNDGNFRFLGKTEFNLIQDTITGQLHTWSSFLINKKLSEKVDITDVYDKDTLLQMFSSKQDLLVNGTNIKTVNNQNILGSGNIEIASGPGTETTLWTGNNTGEITATLSDNINNYDFIKFRMVDGVSYLFFTIKVSDWLKTIASGKAQMLVPTAWNSTDRRLIIFVSGSTDMALKFNINGSLYVQEIIGIKGNVDISTIRNVKTMTLTGCKTDGSGYLKDSNLQSIDVPGVLIGCKILNPTSSMITGGMLQWILQNSTASDLNKWAVKLLSWDQNSYGNLTGLNAELIYV